MNEMEDSGLLRLEPPIQLATNGEAASQPEQLLASTGTTTRRIPVATHNALQRTSDQARVLDILLPPL